ncbi:MAG TPA: TrkA family potassium uptake protein [Dehalococcoidia bacterium]|nr:TrkA family potassium uptake protein [Dehalococcoidia bacterium]
MKVIIMGCSRVGAQLATEFDAEGHKVTIIDVDSYSFRKLPNTFKGTALVGSGLDEESLKKAGIEEADVFIAVTQGDNRNVMACQIAKHIYRIPKVVCRIYDPIREDMYRNLGLRTVSPTKVVAKLLREQIEG